MAPPPSSCCLVAPITLLCHSTRTRTLDSTRLYAAFATLLMIPTAHQLRGPNHQPANVRSDLALSSGIWHPSLLLISSSCQPETGRDGTGPGTTALFALPAATSQPACPPACLPSPVLRPSGSPCPRPALLRIRLSCFLSESGQVVICALDHSRALPLLSSQVGSSRSHPSFPSWA